jgi:sortase A
VGLKEKMRRARTIGFVLIALGLVLIAAYIAARVDSSLSSRAGIRAFKAEREAIAKQQKSMPGLNMPSTAVDFSLWADKRKIAYEQSLAQYSGTPMAVLEIPKLELEVPVFDGTDDLTLNRGVGRIQGTARPGEKGNIGIAGHRDGFFRGLKDLKVGDVIDLELPGGVTTYTVKEVKIVNPNDVEVLKAQSFPTLTLVTCYPFYFIGSAPQRYIVQASLTADTLGKKPDVEPNSMAGKIKNQEETR